ncbi:MAG: MBL fold metallo-hydrolase, partial [Proteobacteria bacterium]|nr:MBL fold metallo-hydrolase [Pseudomonadota bacterium]
GGQGEAVLVEFPYGKKMLVDGGGFHSDVDIDIGERAIAPFLWKKKITKLDYVVLTHPHPDHLNGLPFIARNFKPGVFWWNGDEVSPPLAEKLHQIIGSVKGNSRVVNRTTPSLAVNGVRIDFLNPPPQSSWVGNNNALALRITLGEVSFFLTGDIQKEAEADIIQTGKNLRSTVIKVPHHGSLTSSSEEFIRAVRPMFAVFTGKLGRFLPHSRIIQRYKEMGVEVIRIDQQGAVSFVTDGKMLWVKKLQSGIMTSVIQTLDHRPLYRH